MCIRDRNLAEVWPIGHDAENLLLWLWRTGEVAAVAPDGRIAARYRWREMGVSGGERFDGLAISNGRIWIASSAGLLTFDGGQWRNQGVPPKCTVITNVALAPDGSVWVPVSYTHLDVYKRQGPYPYRQA